MPNQPKTINEIHTLGYGILQSFLDQKLAAGANPHSPQIIPDILYF
jgi:hypothetical protein